MNISLPDTQSTEEFGVQTGMRILKRPHLCRNIFLFGEMGSGKTSFSRGFAHGLGISHPIQSPTFALISQHKIPQNKENLDIFAHMDLYRINDSAHFHSLEIIDIFENSNTITIMEWSENFPKEKMPSMRIEIHFSRKKFSTGRSAHIQFFSPFLPSDDTIRTFLEKQNLSFEEKKKTAEVTKKGLFIAEKFIAKGRIVDKNLVRVACLLYNIGHNSSDRTVSFLRENTYLLLAETLSYIFSYTNGHPLILEEQCILGGILLSQKEKSIGAFEKDFLNPLLFQAGTTTEEVQNITLADV